MRKWSIILLLFLTGCTVSADSLVQRTEKTLLRAVEANSATIVNHTTALYQFYLPKHMGKRASNEISMIFQSSNVDILMNIDAANIIIQRFYRASLGENSLRSLPLFHDSLMDTYGQFMDVTGRNAVNYRFILQEVGDGFYSIVLQTDTAMLTSVVPLTRVEGIVFDMMSVAKTISVKREAIVSTYSNKQIVNYQRQTLELFEQIAPDSGRVSDMLSIVEGNMNFNQDFLDDFFGELDPQEPIYDETNNVQ